MTYDLSTLDPDLGLITDAALAEHLGVHVNTVTAYRNRRDRPSATTLGEPSRPFQLRMTISLMTLVREVNAKRVAAGRESNLSGVMRDAMLAGLPLLE